jgi:uroporphyrinogen decarboxylase
MTKKERIRALIKGKETDGQPYHSNMTRKIRKKLADFYGIETEAVEQHVGNHLLYLSFTTPEGWNTKSRGVHVGGNYSFDLEQAGPDTFIDEFGIVWDHREDAYEAGDWCMLDNPIKNMNLGGYRFPDGSAPGRFRNVEKVVENNPDRFNVLSMIGLFDTAWHLTGLQDLLMGMAIEDKAFVNKMLDWALAFNIGVIEQMPAYIDGVRFMEDWGQQKGLMMGLDNWKTFLKPRLKEMYAAVKHRGCAVMSHSCGDISELFPHLIELGVDISDPLQPEVMDIASIKNEFGRDIVLFGGLGCQSTIPNGTPEDVVREAEERLAFLGEGGKYILGSSGSIPTETPVENVAALFEFCRRLPA